MQVIYLSALFEYSVLALCLSARIRASVIALYWSQRFIRALETRQPRVDLHSKRFESRQPTFGTDRR